MKKILLILVLILNFTAFAKEYYVSIGGDDKNDGLTEVTAWRSISHAAKKAKSGDTVWIKAGNYGNENVIIKKNGKEGNPISFIGYKNSPGDITSTYYTYSKNTPLDSEEMPMLDGGNRGKVARGIDLTSRSYIIIKNIQITNYSVLIKGGGRTHDLILDNIIAKSAGDYDAVTTNQGSGYGFLFDNDDSFNNTFSNCIAINATSVNFRVYGSNNIIDKCQSYCDEGTDSDNTGVQASTDYYVVIRGNNNIIRNTHVERVGKLEHGGHGICLKSVGVKTENNLIENCTIINIKGAIEARHRQVNNNIFKNIIIEGTKSSSKKGGIVIQDGASNNIFENFTISGTNEAFRWYETSEDGGAQENGHHNSFKNIIVKNVGQLIYTGKLNANPIGAISNNSFENCTFVNIGEVYGGFISFDNTNTIKNCIFNDVRKSGNKHAKYTPNWKETYNNYFSNGFNAPNGEGNISVDPQFEDEASGNFRIKSISELIDAGKIIDNVQTDFEGNQRPQGESHDIGAFEYSENSTGSINANAGEDVEICSGDNTTLTASGGLTYQWSTGETTASIIVSPNETTTYSVTVSNGGDSDSDEVTVTVDDLPSVDLGADITLCFGESITLTAEGNGDFLWSTGETTSSITLNPVTTTTYSVTASNSCSSSVTDEMIVNITPEITLDAGADVTLCSGEIVTLTADGNGDFLWNTGETTSSITVNPTVTSVYTVISSSGNCSLSDEVTVTVEDLPSVNLGADVTLCFGESITLTAEGTGESLWSTGETTSSITVSPVTTTTYSVTASNSCSSDTDDIIVTVNRVTADAGSDVTIEEGESVKLTANGGDSYLWSNGVTTKSITASPASTRNYKVTVYKNGCEDTDEVKVTVESKITNPPPANAFAGDNISICLGESITLTANGGETYLWSTGDIQKNIKVSPTRTTTYVLSATRGGITNTDTVIVTVENCSNALVQDDLNKELLVFPNPSTGVLNIKVSSLYSEFNLVLINLNGSIVYSDKMNSKQGGISKQIDLSRLAKGVYFVRLFNSNQNMIKKILLI